MHAVHLADTEIRMLAERGATVAHCPHSNLKLGSGIAPVARMLEAGVRVGLGTDGSASNNRLDLLLEARTASLLAKGSSGDAAAFGAHRVLRAATLDGARALGLEHAIGSLVAGKWADLVAIDLSDPDLQPVHDPVAQLIFAAGRDRVTDVWIAGEPVVVRRQMVAARALDTVSMSWRGMSCGTIAWAKSCRKPLDPRVFGGLRSATLPRNRASIGTRRARGALPWGWLRLHCSAGVARR